MAESAYLPGSQSKNPPRILPLVRVTHWINSVSFLGARRQRYRHTYRSSRLYWGGEQVTVGVPSLFDLPIPFMLGHSGWGRYLHFLSAWACVFNGLLYGVSAYSRGHFRKDLLGPKTNHDDAPGSYNALQRLAYSAVISSCSLS